MDVLMLKIEQHTRLVEDMAKFYVDLSSPNRDRKEKQGRRPGDGESRRKVFEAVNTVFKEPIFRLLPKIIDKLSFS